MANYIVAALLFLAVGFAIAYLVKSRKKGTGCSGCPMAQGCPKISKEGLDCGRSLKR